MTVSTVKMLDRGEFASEGNSKQRRELSTQRAALWVGHVTSGYLGVLRSGSE